MADRNDLLRNSKLLVTACSLLYRSDCLRQLEVGSRVLPCLSGDFSLYGENTGASLSSYSSGLTQDSTFGECHLQTLANVPARYGYMRLLVVLNGYHVRLCLFLLMASADLLHPPFYLCDVRQLGCLLFHYLEDIGEGLAAGRLRRKQINSRGRLSAEPAIHVNDNPNIITGRVRASVGSISRTPPSSFSLCRAAPATAVPSPLPSPTWPCGLPAGPIRVSGGPTPAWQGLIRSEPDLPRSS